MSEHNKNTQQSSKSGIRYSALQMFSCLLEWEYIQNRQLAAAGVEGIIPVFGVNVLGMVSKHVNFFQNLHSTAL
jgi:hypothetical protein